MIYTTQVAATNAFLTLAKSSGGGDLVDKTYTVQYSKDPASTSWDNDAAMKLYKQVMAKYYPAGKATDGLNFFGVGTAEAFVELLYSAGKNPTRASLMKAYRAWDQPNPFLLPGNRQKTGASDQLPLQCFKIVKFSDGVFTPVSKLKCDTAGT